ncbi:uncharacterized protein BDV17DRAFT_227850 [Aspergillus undulatus]|uniref:uncharacterized protein n=1 Tax=Aspergillus undulatus TaxID=1810928 RepID=UPI003CCDD124
MHSIPPSFYRVQHDRSYTIFNPQDGFESNGHYLMPYSFWINNGRIRSHLMWGDSPVEPTPFISVFDDIAEARKRVRHHQCRGDTGIFIAEIDTSSLCPKILDIEFADITIQLPAWANNQGTTFISSRVVREHLRIQNCIFQDSEWFALDYIPINIVHKIRAV